MLLRFYPVEWRARYGDEFAALLDDMPLSLWTLVDVVLGALDARCLAYFRRAGTVITRLRRTEITVFCAYIAFVVPGMGFAKIVEYDDFRDATSAHPLIGIAFTALVVGAYVALAAVIVGGLPLAFVAARQALAARRWGILALLGVPALAFGVFAGYIWLVGKVIAPAIHAGSGVTPGNVRLAISLVVVFTLCAIASTMAVAQAIARSEIPLRLYRFARIPAAVASLAMLVVTVSLLVWGLSLRADVPDLFNGNDGLLASNTAANWLVIVALMGVATALALWATVRGVAAPPAEASPAVAG